MTDTRSMIQRPLPAGLVQMYNLTTSGAVLNDANNLANAIGRAGFSQAIYNNAYADSIKNYWPDSLRRDVAERHNGFKDDSQNTSEFSLGITVMFKRYPPPDSFERSFTEGTSIFTSNVDHHGGQMIASIPVINTLQHRRSVLQQLNSSYSGGPTSVLRAAQYIDDAFAQKMASDTATLFGTDKKASRTPEQAQALVNMAQSQSARHYEQSLVSGTGNIMQLTAKSPEDFAQKFNYLGAIIKFEPGHTTEDPVAAITIPGFGEKREANLFGSPRTNDFCYVLVRKWAREGMFRTAALCGGEFTGLASQDLLQARGFSTNDMPHTISGVDQQIERSDTWYIDRETEMATVHMTTGEWDPENSTFKARVAEDRAESLNGVSQVVYDAYLTGGKIYPIGQNKERFATLDSPETQLKATMSPDCYNSLQRIFLYNLNRHYR